MPRWMRTERTWLHLLLAEERLRRGEPEEFDAFLLGVLHLALRARHVGAVAAIEALHRLRPPGAPRCARSPSPRCRRRRSPRRACLWHRARPSRKSGTASPSPLRLEAVEIVERRRDAGAGRRRGRRCRAPCRRRSPSARRRGGSAARPARDVAADLAVEMEGDRLGISAAASRGAARSPSSSLKLGMP